MHALLKRLNVKHVNTTLLTPLLMEFVNVLVGTLNNASGKKLTRDNKMSKVGHS